MNELRKYVIAIIVSSALVISISGSAVYLHYLLMMTSILMAPFTAVYSFALYVAALVFATDTPGIIEGNLPNTVHTVGYGINVFPLWSMLLPLVMLSRMSPLKSITRSDIYIVCALVIPYVVSSLTNMQNMGENASLYISDLSYMINIMLGILLVQVLGKRGCKALTIARIVFSAVALLGIYGIVEYALGVGRVTDWIIKPINDSFRNVLPWLVIAGLQIFLVQRRTIKLSQYYLMMAMLIVGLVNMLWYTSRGNIILLILSLALMLIFVNKKQHPTTVLRKYVLVCAGVGSVLITLMFVEYLQPGYSTYLRWKMYESMKGFEEGYYVSSAGVRYYSLLNIVRDHSVNGTILFGTGPAGYFTDIYKPFVHLINGDGAFPKEWIISRKLYKPHESLAYLLLKIGIVGIICYYIVFWVSFKRGIVIASKVVFAYDKIMWLSISFFLPFLAYKAFTSKLQILLGILIGVTMLGVRELGPFVLKRRGS